MLINTNLHVILQMYIHTYIHTYIHVRTCLKNWAVPVQWYLCLAIFTCISLSCPVPWLWYVWHVHSLAHIRCGILSSAINYTYVCSC